MAGLPRPIERVQIELAKAALIEDLSPPARATISYMQPAEAMKHLAEAGEYEAGYRSDSNGAITVIDDDDEGAV